MPMVRLELNQATYARLVAAAIRERRAVPWQAVVTLERALRHQQILGDADEVEGGHTHSDPEVLGHLSGAPIVAKSNSTGDPAS